MSIKDWYSKNRQNIPMWLTIGVFAVCGLFCFYLIGNLYLTTVIHYEEYARAASSDQWKLMSYASSRGMIYDIGNEIYHFQTNTPKRTRADAIFNDFIILVKENFRKEYY